MAKIIKGIGISHAPGILGWPEKAPQTCMDSINNALEALKKSLNKAKPDIIIAILDDHFENHYRSLMPTISMSIAQENIGPAKQWLQALRLNSQEKFHGAPVIAEKVFHSLVHQGFDLTRLANVEYGNNLIVPWKNLDISNEIPVIPIFINVFSAPILSYQRAFLFGKAIREAILNLDEDLNFAVIATGGLSHWPPFWTHSSDPRDEFLQQRMKKFQSEGKPYLSKDPNLYLDLADYEIRMAEISKSKGIPLTNPEWDLEFLKALENADENYIQNLKYEDVEKQGGHGGHEILNWITLFGAMNSTPGKLHAYEDVTEWICGMAYMEFDNN